MEFLDLEKESKKNEVEGKKNVVSEVDAVLRRFCEIDDEKKTHCGRCVYREFFYGCNDVGLKKDIVSE